MSQIEAKKNAEMESGDHKTWVEAVTSKITELEKKEGFSVPANYSVANAVKSAYYKLMTAKTKDKQPVLKVCDNKSIVNALMDMTIQGLSPAKNQCYFIPYGKELQLQRSYFGTVAAVKRMSNVEHVYANIVYEGDKFKFGINPETGVHEILEHEQSLENIDIKKIKGAYAVVVTSDDSPNYVEIMSMAQIKQAWGQGMMNGNSKAHQNFTDQMAKKTVINRACKMFVNTSDDSDLLVEAFNNTTENEYKEYDEDEEIKEEIKEAPKKKIGFEQKPKVQKAPKEEIKEEKQQTKTQSDKKQPSLEDAPF